MSADAHTLTVVIPLAVRPRGGRKVIITPDVLEVESRHDITLIAAEKINASYVSRILRLTLLAPDVVGAILDGRQPEGMTLPGLVAGVAVEWEGQRLALAVPLSR